MNKLPAGYHEGPTCQNCGHCVIYTPCDDPTNYLCGFGADSRPMHDNELNRKSKFRIGSKEWHQERGLWCEWSKGREVSAGGTCDKWKPQRPSEVRL